MLWSSYPSSPLNASCSPSNSCVTPCCEKARHCRAVCLFWGWICHLRARNWSSLWPLGGVWLGGEQQSQLGRSWNLLEVLHGAPGQSWAELGMDLAIAIEPERGHSLERGYSTERGVTAWSGG